MRLLFILLNTNLVYLLLSQLQQLQQSKIYERFEDSAYKIKIADG